MNDIQQNDKFRCKPASGEVPDHQQKTRYKDSSQNGAPDIAGGGQALVLFLQNQVVDDHIGHQRQD